MGTLHVEQFTFSSLSWFSLVGFSWKFTCGI